MAVHQSQTNGNGVNQPKVIVPDILRLTEELSQFSSFEPNPSLDKVLSSISHICHQTDVSPAVEDQVCLLSRISGEKDNSLIRSKILNDPRIISTLPKLRDLWAKAAGELEDSWASRILASATPEKGIRKPQSSMIS
jgi:hypothetical protein